MKTLITLRCNECRAQFDEGDAVAGEYCPECGCSSLFERETQDCVDQVLPSVAYTAHFIDRMMGAK